MSGPLKDASEIKIEVPPEVAPGVYANAASVAQGNEEFILDFGMVMPGQRDRCVVRSRVILHPDHARRLVAALQDQIAKHDEARAQQQGGKS